MSSNKAGRSPSVVMLSASDLLHEEGKPPMLPPKQRQLKKQQQLKRDVENMGMRRLLATCENMRIDDENLKTESRLKEAIYRNMKETGSRGPKPTSLAVCFSKCEEFSLKQAECGKLLDTVEQFVTLSKISGSALVEKLCLPAIDRLTDDLKKARCVCSKTPMLLIAGTTSSGKSTLLNALLGETILPTSYNASTFVLCELKYGDRKCAIIHLDQNDHMTSETIDLTSEDSLSKFKSYLTTRVQTTEIPVCTRVEVFWPLDLLKYVHLVDSPGVTEDEASVCVARRITEQCQRDLACGCIYVIDATRAAEEAAQVGGLLSSSRRNKVHSSISSSVLFVVNKWDHLEDMMQDGQEYLDTLSKHLQSYWGPFQEKQLITMNAKLALVAQEAGHTTADMHALCQGIMNILPKAMDSTIMRALREPCALMDSIEGRLENAVRQLHLPLEERDKQFSDSMGKLLSCKKSLESAEFIKMLDKKMEELILQLGTYLKSAEARAFALKWKRPDLPAAQQTFMDDRNVQEMAVSRMCETICQSELYEEFCQWAKHTLMPKILHVLKNLSQVKTLIRGGCRMSYHSADDNHHDNGISTGFIAMALPAIVIGVPLALAVGAVVGPVFGLLKMVSSIKGMNFRRAVERAYSEIVERYCADNHTGLKKVVTGLLQMSCKAVCLIQGELPEMVLKLECEMEAQAELDREDIGNYNRALTVCQDIKGHMSKLVLKLDIHEYSSSDFPKAISSLPGVMGSYGKVVQVSVVGKGAGALKVIHEEITETNAEAYMKELNSCRKLQNENVVSFFGSVIVSKTPFKLGLLFEWCGGGTLADEFFGAGNLPAGRQEGFIRGRDMLLQILNGVKYLHSYGIVHRDLKPENILLTDRKEVKLGDMGLTKPVFQVTGSLCGTLPYIAPEVFLSQPYGLPTDMYAIGIIMWEMWHGKRAYLDIQLSQGNFMKGVVSGELRPGNYSPGLYRRKALLQQRESIDMRMVGTNWAHLSESCWTSDYKQRPTAEAAHHEVMNIRTQTGLQRGTSELSY